MRQTKVSLLQCQNICEEKSGQIYTVAVDYGDEESPKIIVESTHHSVETAWSRSQVDKTNFRRQSDDWIHRQIFRISAKKTLKVDYDKFK